MRERDLLALETAASRAGEGAANGILSPQAVRNAVVQQGRTAYVTGSRDIGELARAAEGVIKPLPTTTAGGVRGLAPNVVSGGLGIGGYAAVLYVDDNYNILIRVPTLRIDF